MQYLPLIKHHASGQLRLGCSSDYVVCPAPHMHVAVLEV